MVTINTDSVTFSYTVASLITELNILSSHKSGKNSELLEIIEVTNEQTSIIVSLLKQVVPVVYKYFIKNSATVSNGMSIDSSAIIIKIDKYNTSGGQSVFSENKLTLIDGLLWKYIVTHTLAEWLLLKTSNADWYNSLIKDDESLIRSLIENLNAIDITYNQISYTVTDL